MCVCVPLKTTEARACSSPVCILHITTSAALHILCMRVYALCTFFFCVCSCVCGSSQFQCMRGRFRLSRSRESVHRTHARASARVRARVKRSRNYNRICAHARERTARPNIIGIVVGLFGCMPCVCAFLSVWSVRNVCESVLWCVCACVCLHFAHNIVLGTLKRHTHTRARGMSLYCGAMEATRGTTIIVVVVAIVVAVVVSVAVVSAFQPARPAERGGPLASSVSPNASN